MTFHQRATLRHTVYQSVEQVPQEQWDELTCGERDLTMDRRLRAAGRSDAEVRALRGEAAAPEEDGLIFGEAAAQAAKAGR